MRKVGETDRYLLVHIDRLALPPTPLWDLTAALPEGAQCAKAARVARFIDAEIAIEAALPSAGSGVSTMRGSRGGLPLGRTVDACDRGAV